MIHLKLGLLIIKTNSNKFAVLLSKPKYVGIFLCKLHTFLSNKHLAFSFKVSEQTIANYINLAREDLLENLVPKFLNKNNRSVLINHSIPTKMLFNIPENLQYI